ncbi:MAG: hypothetical protein F4X93_04395 [Proteobacteria bacterium]|nr:hypothetical protein [Pseudomonadota bacterium]
MARNIRIREPFARPVSRIQIVLIFLVVMAIAFGLGTMSMNLPFLEDLVASEVSDKNKVIRSLEKSNDRLKNEVALAKRNAEAESVALKELKSMMREKDAELLQLTQELQFYRTLYSPDADNKPVQVRALQLHAGDTAGQFAYRLVLTGVPRKREKISGVIGLSVTGEQQGVAKELVLAVVRGARKDEAPRFSFRYFQEISGSLSLPEDFAPSEVQVELLRDGRKSKPIVASYSWGEVYERDELHTVRSEE